MGYEIDYIPVGNGKRSGDAIALRFGNLNGTRDEQKVVIIDGGFRDSGELLVNHIVQHYNTDTVDFVISTHPDLDHISGLSVVLEKLNVKTLLMHKPWEHAEDIKSFFRDKKTTISGLTKKIEKSVRQASNLEDLAISKDIPIHEPFQGDYAFDGAMLILGPSREYYESLLPLFRKTPEPTSSLAKFIEPIQKVATEIIEWIEDRMDIDILGDDGQTCAENNTSTIILFEIDDKLLLFTGDAGISALNGAVEYADTLEIKLDNLSFLDVPHHGSKHNVGSSLLKKIKAKSAFISASPDSEKHPSDKVTNALQKHGASVFATQGVSLRHKHNAPERVGWSTATPIPFYDKVKK